MDYWCLYYNFVSFCTCRYSPSVYRNRYNPLPGLFQVITVEVSFLGLIGSTGALQTTGVSEYSHNNVLVIAPAESMPPTIYALLPAIYGVEL